MKQPPKPSNPWIHSGLWNNVMPWLNFNIMFWGLLVIIERSFSWLKTEVCPDVRARGNYLAKFPIKNEGGRFGSWCHPAELWGNVTARVEIMPQILATKKGKHSSLMPSLWLFTWVPLHLPFPIPTILLSLILSSGACSPPHSLPNPATSASPSSRSCWRGNWRGN